MLRHRWSDLTANCSARILDWDLALTPLNKDNRNNRQDSEGEDT
jgi:hypothetical protein